MYEENVINLASNLNGGIEVFQLEKFAEEVFTDTLEADEADSVFLNRGMEGDVFEAHLTVSHTDVSKLPSRLTHEHLTDCVDFKIEEVYWDIVGNADVDFHKHIPPSWPDESHDHVSMVTIEVRRDN